MAQIMNIEEFIKKFGKKTTGSDMTKLLNLEPGENNVIAFGPTHIDNIVFIRVTEYHFATMSVYEFNGIG